VSWHCLPTGMCVALHWLDCSKWIVERHDQYHHVASATVAMAVSPIGIVLLNSYFGSLHSGVQAMKSAMKERRRWVTF
jgi:hypothetical protein